MLQARLRSSFSHVGQALRDPEQFALSWHEGVVRYPSWVWLGLLGTAIVGTTTYGMTMGILGGTPEILRRGLQCTTAAGLAWLIALPALYILNSLSGSRLRVSTTLLAALVTVSWGGLAMIATLPINWFFMVSLPDILSSVWSARALTFINIIIYAAVGAAMIDVFGRVMERLEPARGQKPMWWLLIVGAIGTELFYAFELFDFTVSTV